MIIFHLNIAPSAQHSREPLCHATGQHGDGWSRGYYTNVKDAVTCRRCLKSLGAVLPPKSAPSPLLPTCTVEPYPF